MPNDMQSLEPPSPFWSTFWAIICAAVVLYCGKAFWELI